MILSFLSEGQKKTKENKQTEKKKKGKNKTKEEAEMQNDKKKKKSEKKETEVSAEALRWIKIIFAVILCTCLGIPTAIHFTTAKNDDFNIKTGFDETQQNKVWMTYNLTDWEEVGGLLFTDDALITLDSAVQDSKFAKRDEMSRLNPLLKKNKKSTKYKKESYRKIILCIMYELNKEGAKKAWNAKDVSDSAQKQAEESTSQVSSENTTDAQTKAKKQAEEAAKKADKMISGEDTQSTDGKDHASDFLYLHEVYGIDYPKTADDEMNIVINKFFEAEDLYLHSSFTGEERQDDDYSIDDTSDTSGLKCVIQATIYGTDYISYNKAYEYSKDKSKKYREQHSELARVEADDFADQVLSYYKATPIKNSDKTKVTG